MSLGVKVMSVIQSEICTGIENQATVLHIEKALSQKNDKNWFYSSTENRSERSFCFDELLIFSSSSS